jgi:hypothetical protein
LQPRTFARRLPDALAVLPAYCALLRRWQDGWLPCWRRPYCYNGARLGKGPV